MWLKKLLLGVLVVMVAVWAWAWVGLKTSKHEYAQLSDEQQLIAKEYLKGKLTPAPDGWRYETFYPQENVNLRTGLIEHANSKGLVIVVPGFTGTIEMVMREIDQLYAAGFSVAAIEYRGQGASWRPLSHPEKGYVEDYAILAADLAKFAHSINQDNQPLYFYSISMGAHITIRMALEHDVDVAAYSFIVPMVKINTGEFSYSLTQKIASIASAVGLGELYAPGQSAWPGDGSPGDGSPGDDYVFGAATGCNANPDLAQSQSALFAERPELRTSGTTLGWLKATMASTDYILGTPNKARLNNPVKLFTAGIDELVDTPAAQQFCQSLSDCELVHKPQSRHCITREDMAVYDEMIQDSIRHFENAKNTQEDKPL